MTFAYDFERLNDLLKTILQSNLSPQAWQWLEKEGDAAHSMRDIQKFNIAFVAMPRKTGKDLVELTLNQKQPGEVRKGFDIRGWTVDRLSRVWLLSMLNPEPKEKYVDVIENLFLSAEMSELVALYSSLPLLAYPDSWRKRCAEGIRSNIGQVLEAVICNNPYPAEQLDEQAWNQLVLKAIFTDKPVLEIVGLKERRNRALAESLSDYAHERWAAQRDVNPLLWICTAPFVDNSIFSDIQRLFASSDPIEKAAAALVCAETSFPPAKQLLDERRGLKEDIANGTLTWEGIASKKLQKA